MVGKIGAKIKIPRNNVDLHGYLFGEDQSRFLIEVNEKNKDEVSNILKENSVYFEVLGKTQKEYFDLDKEFNIKLADLIHLNSCWFKNYFKEN